MVIQSSGNTACLRAGAFPCGLLADRSLEILGTRRGLPPIPLHPEVE